MALTPATLESTRRSTQDAAIWQRGSFGHSATSFDEASMSICLPDALPETAQQLSRLHPTVVSQAADGYIDAATTSQEFLEYSLAVHEALPSSMPQIDLPNMPANDSFDETTQSFSQSTSFSLLSTVPPLPTDIPHWQPLTNLVDVPSASYLLSLAPQTVTVNLVVAIVSVGVPRVIDKNNGNRNSNNRRDRRPVSLVELVVGDETGSGFGLTIWMDGGGGQQQQTTHIAAAAHLRVKEDSGLPVAWQLLEKTARVRDWALQYVLVDGHRFDSGDGGASQNNPNGSNEEMRSKTTPAWMLPPADTQ
ncbi:hypothetical protein SBRCBS47491_006146 [Sporothrix bragantina]|uniref:Nucleic acid-binding protein n=1 Tax=Sporothrix bragantina TaxID=671064 RepID=A0ABP0C2X6_9PEZI